MGKLWIKCYTTHGDLIESQSLPVRAQLQPVFMQRNSNLDLLTLNVVWTPSRDSFTPLSIFLYV